MTTTDNLLRTLPDDVLLLSAAEAAEYLGVAPGRLDELHRRGWLPTIRFGKGPRRYHRTDLAECAAQIRAADLEDQKAQPKFIALRPGETPKRGVYFIQAGEGGPIKIGYSGNIRVRLLGLQAASPAELRLLNVRPGDPKVETQLHQKLAPHRLHHEWFEPVEAVLEEVASA